MQPISLIALDIDGVLNSRDFAVKTKGMSNETYNLDPDAIKLLNELVLMTTMSHCPTKILLSSTWRTDFANYLGINMFFEAVGIVPVCIGRTAYDQTRRGWEIAAWIAKERIQKRYEVQRLVILDDDNDMEELTPWLVLTNHNVGLTKEDIEKAYKILTQPFEFQVNLGI